ncbi:MAG: winged helix-turn-helix transcriptional regulator [Solirubrobacteraceae bacterium]
MVPRPQHVAHATLDLLVEDWTVPILRALMVAPRRPSELESRLPGVTHSALMRRLGELVSKRLASRSRASVLNPTVVYALTSPGRLILDVMGAAERWERRWTDETTDGISALHLIADEPTREILLALAEGPLAPAQLGRQISLSRSPLRRRLAGLTARDVLERRGSGGHISYALTESARDLMLVSIAAARWQWEVEAPDHPPPALNVVHMVQMFAERAELPADLEGVCHLHVEDGAEKPVVLLAAQGRRLTALPAHTGTPHAVCHATPHEWCDALLLRRWGSITTTYGDRALMAALIACISSSLLT